MCVTNYESTDQTTWTIIECYPLTLKNIKQEQPNR